MQNIAEGTTENALNNGLEPAATSVEATQNKNTETHNAKSAGGKNAEAHTADSHIGAEKSSVGAQGTESAAKKEMLGGKFKDVKALLDAYNSLQSVFTERSKKLKELEKGKVNAAGQTIDDLPSRSGDLLEKIVGLNKITDEEMSRLKATAETFDGDKSIGLVKAYVNLLEDKLKDGEKYSSREYILRKIDEDRALKDEVIKNYLGNIVAKKPEANLISGGGQGVYAPPPKPNTLAEAGEIARQIFIEQENTKW